jgi:putative endonuclease
LHIGVTSNLPQRIWQHRNDVLDGSSKEHQAHLLVYLELHFDMEAAIVREEQLKKWEGRWKIRLIENGKPYWRDSYSELLDGA